MQYSTTFAGGDANPISEGGVWSNTTDPVASGGWHRVQIKNGLACATGINEGFNDSIAVLAGFGDDVDVTVVIADGTGGNLDTASHENEILLNMLLGAQSARGYEVLFEGDAASMGVSVVRWNGAMGDFTNLSQAGVLFAGFPYTCRAKKVGANVTTWINGVQQFVQDLTEGSVPLFTGGQPGIGFFRQGGGTPGADPQTGMSSFTADDGAGHPRPGVD